MEHIAKTLGGGWKRDEAPTEDGDYYYRFKRDPTKAASAITVKIPRAQEARREL